MSDNDDDERDMTHEEQAEFFISAGITSAIDDLTLALRMNDWSEASYEEKNEHDDDFITIEADGRSTLKVEEALAHLESADEYVKKEPNPITEKELIKRVRAELWVLINDYGEGLVEDDHKELLQDLLLNIEYFQDGRFDAMVWRELE